MAGGDRTNGRSVLKSFSLFCICFINCKISQTSLNTKERNSGKIKTVIGSSVVILKLFLYKREEIDFMGPGPSAPRGHWEVQREGVSGVTRRPKLQAVVLTPVIFVPKIRLNMSFDCSLIKH